MNGQTARKSKAKYPAGDRVPAVEVLTALPEIGRFVLTLDGVAYAVEVLADTNGDTAGLRFIAARKAAMPRDVRFTAYGPECDCPDRLWRNRRCKHTAAAERLIADGLV